MFKSIRGTALPVCLSLFLCAAAFAPAAGAQDIVLGQVGPFTVIPVPDAIQVNQGIKAWMAQANKDGGVRGRKLAFFELDDRYNAEDFVARFKEAMQRKPVALLSPIGSAAIKRLLDDKLLDASDIVIMNAIPGAEALRDPGHPKLFHVRAGDRQQIEKIVNHARTIGITRMSVLYQDLPIGTSGFQVVTAEAARLKGLDIQGVKAGIDAASQAAASEQIAKQNAHAVLVVGAPRFMADGVVQLRKAGVAQSLFVLSYVPAPLIVKLAGVQGARGVGIAQTFPNPNGKTMPLVQGFQAAMRTSFPDVKEYTSFHLEGYLSARIMTEALKRTKGEITPDNVARTLRTMGEMDFGGFRVDFTKGNIGSRFVDIAVIGGDGNLRY